MYSAKSRALFALSAVLISGCASNYSPNTYSSNAVQLANKVEAGTIVGYREVAISANGNIGAVTGGAAGGILGAQYADSALIAVGGSTVGAIVGNALDHAAGDTTGWEYIIRKANGDLLSVTQREPKPLMLAQKVLVIMGPQARVVPDYSVIPEAPPAPVVAEKKPEPVPKEPVRVEVVLSLPPGVSAQPANAVPAARTHEPGLVSVTATPEDIAAGQGISDPQ
jgi:outer membrane lipoprotein SlyB